MKKYTTLLFIFLYSCSIYAILPKSSYALPAYSTNKHEQIIEYERYTVSYNTKCRIPNWVAWELTYDQTLGPSKGDLTFEKDKSIENCPSPAEYTNSGYSRGHMCPKADNKWNDKAYKESFYMTNVCPQNHEDLNNRTWKALEELCRKNWCKKYDKIYIVCGPIIKGSSKKIGPNQDIYVPEEFFKAVLRVKFNKRGVIGAEAIGYIFKQDGSVRLCPVDYIENRTGLNLFHKLPNYVQDRAEADFNRDKWDRCESVSKTKR
ncbi:MAG: DNA/RNA non-specific endonuclease [Bacteroidaceae bacterium]|nr:DNA/RNA non-specific endonuclease [Bacteroidaceae bacterium]